MFMRTLPVFRYPDKFAEFEIIPTSGIDDESDQSIAICKESFVVHPLSTCNNEEPILEFRGT